MSTIPVATSMVSTTCARAFATMNYKGMDRATLKRLMRHHSYSTTERYIMGERLERASYQLHVPEVVWRQAN